MKDRIGLTLRKLGESEIYSRLVLLDNILTYFDTQEISKEQATRIVGGPKKLEKLIAEGKVYADKRAATKNGKWWCNAGQALRHIKRRID